MCVCVCLSVFLCVCVCVCQLACAFDAECNSLVQSCFCVQLPVFLFGFVYVHCAALTTPLHETKRVHCAEAAVAFRKQTRCATGVERRKRNPPTEVREGGGGGGGAKVLCACVEANGGNVPAHPHAVSCVPMVDERVGCNHTHTQRAKQHGNSKHRKKKKKNSHKYS